MKHCASCGTTKPFEDFHRAARSKDGRQAYCKECRSQAKRVSQEFTTYTRVRDGKTQTVTRRVDGHGLSRKTPLYKVWCGMRRRCHEPKAQNYRWYGGRGIAVEEPWKTDFMSFYRWATASGYEPGMELDRMNNDGNYSPDNCRWVVKLANLKNRSTYLPEELEQRLRAFAEENDKPVLTVIRDSVEEYLAAHQGREVMSRCP